MFVEQPPSVVLAPAGILVLKCSVITGYGISWHIVFTNGNVEYTADIRDSALIEELRNEGFELLTSPSTNTSFLAVNGGIKENNRTTVICVAEKDEDILIRKRSLPTLLIFYGNCNHLLIIECVSTLYVVSTPYTPRALYLHTPRPTLSVKLNLRY